MYQCVNLWFRFLRGGTFMCCWKLYGKFISFVLAFVAGVSVVSILTLVPVPKVTVASLRRPERPELPRNNCGYSVPLSSEKHKGGSGGGFGISAGSNGSGYGSSQGDVYGSGSG